MASRHIRVWLPGPDSAALMGGLPDGMTADVWTGGEQLPDSADEVEVVVLPFGVPRSRMPLLAKLPRLRLIQLMSAGAERAVPYPHRRRAGYRPAAAPSVRQSSPCHPC
jgi:hypothetical protein